jgi:lipopolysaccharide transport system ATP-binding protein
MPRREFPPANSSPSPPSELMSDLAISVESLSKSYLVGHDTAGTERYTTLRDIVARKIRSMARKTCDIFRGQAILQGDEIEEFWALKEISFSIRQGERVGVIGSNGAGKSTLLKILSRITEPTAGRIGITGRVASLLEVGTGFHPELSGRENIYLNGAILGMSRREIQRKFDEIVDFAEVERFLDTPVKRYSSGMYVRLAFAVAAHLEPEILIIDEVLAVGDAQFQKKCLGKMEDVSKDGRTILFVSHNMAAIEQLTESSLVLDRGNLVMSGPTSTCIKHYSALNIDSVEGQVLQYHDTQIRFHAVNDQNQSQSAFRCGTDIGFQIHCESQTRISNVDFQIAVFSTLGFRLLTLSGRFQSSERLTLQGETRVCARWANVCLVPGEYRVALSIYRNDQYQMHWDNVLKINIISGDYYTTGKMPDSGMGPILSDCRWDVCTSDVNRV